MTDNANESSAATNLVILITDTAPEAKADTGTVTEDGAAPEGNVITGGSSNSTDVADRLGADAKHKRQESAKEAQQQNKQVMLAGTGLAGDYGTLIPIAMVVTAYTVDPNNATVNALKDGGKLTETFSYTIKDADGDWSTDNIKPSPLTDMARMAYQTLHRTMRTGNNVGGRLQCSESGHKVQVAMQVQRANLPVERFRSMQEMALQY